MTVFEYSHITALNLGEHERWIWRTEFAICCAAIVVSLSIAMASLTLSSILSSFLSTMCVVFKIWAYPIQASSCVS